MHSSVSQPSQKSNHISWLIPSAPLLPCRLTPTHPRRICTPFEDVLKCIRLTLVDTRLSRPSAAPGPRPCPWLSPAPCRRVLISPGTEAKVPARCSPYDVNASSFLSTSEEAFHQSPYMSVRKRKSVSPAPCGLPAKVHRCRQR